MRNFTKRVQGITLLLLSVPVGLMAQMPAINPTTSQNYIIKRTPRDTASTVQRLLSLPAAKQGTTIEYYDGLGRPLQTIGASAVPSHVRKIKKGKAERCKRGAKKKRLPAHPCPPSGIGKL